MLDVPTFFALKVYVPSDAPELLLVTLTEYCRLLAPATFAPPPLGVGVAVAVEVGVAPPVGEEVGVPVGVAEGLGVGPVEDGLVAK